MTVTLDDLNTTLSPRARARDLTGERFGTLTATAFAGTRKYAQTTATFWHVECDCGATKIVRGTFLRNGQTLTCGDRKAHALTKRGESTHYNVVHGRIYDAYGLAAEYVCSEEDCGKTADDWSAEHDMDPTSIESYVPRCRAHHTIYDAIHTDRTARPLLRPSNRKVA